MIRPSPHRMMRLLPDRRGILSRALAFAGCCLGIVGCATAQTPTLSIDYQWAGDAGPLLAASGPPPSVVVIRWNRRGISDSQAQFVAAQQCLAWNREAQPSGLPSHSGNIVTERYSCVLPQSTVPRAEKPSS